jgi:hypothetical protein
MNVNDPFPPSEDLRSEDIESVGEMELTIAKVERLEFESDGKKQTKGKLSFKETEKHLTLNVTNTNTIAAMFGSKNIDTEWVGKSIILYVDNNVQFGNDIVKGIRVRLIDEKQQTIQAFWTKTRELGFSQKDGQDHLAQFGGDFKKALDALSGAEQF